MPVLIRSVTGLAVVAAGLLTAAAVYTEAHHVADQP
jgi:hypothetical protein